jgi:hypothetical protein
MNPLAPLLVVLALAGPLAARGRPVGRAWLVVGLAASALLWPALAIPGGVPSPAAILGQHPPWQHELDPSQGNPAIADVAYQIEPWLLFVRDEMRAGRLPLWNPFQYAGSPLWANGQSAPLFPLHLLFVVLPLPLGWLLLPWLKVMTGGLGAWWLGRRLGLSEPAALLAAVAFPLAGMPVSFLLFPLGSAVALAPWVLAAVERLAAGRWGVAPLAALAGLQLLSGHPEVCLQTAMLSALYLAVRGVAPPVGRPGAWCRLVGGWAAGAGLAAVHWLPMAVHLVGTSRWQQEASGGVADLAVRLSLPLRLVLPQLYGDPARGTWWGPFAYPSTAVYAGAATLVLAVAGLGAVRRRGGASAGRPLPPPGRDRRWLAVAALLAFSLPVAYYLLGLHRLLALVPFVGRVLHHRMLFGVDLALALLAGAGLDRWRRGAGRRGAAAGAALVLLLLAVAWLVHGEVWRTRLEVAPQLGWTLWVAAVAVLLAAGSRLPRRARRAVGWLLPAIVAADLVVAHDSIHPGLAHDRLFPRTGAVDFLAGRPGRVIGEGAALRPNAATVYRLADVRGDDTLKPARWDRFAARRLGAAHPTYFTPVTRWDPRTLDDLAVRWVLTAPGAPAPVAGARLAYEGADARVWERAAAPGLLRWRDGPPCAAAVAARRPGGWSIDLRCRAPATLVVAESWDRGWRAAMAGGPLAVDRVDDLFLAVRLPAGTGRLELAYRPVGLVAGAAISAATLALLAAVATGLFPGVRRRLVRSSAASPRPAPQCPSASSSAAADASTPTSPLGS